MNERPGSAAEGWDELARTDPLWAVLSDPAKRHSGWKVDDFFAEGQRELDEMLDLAAPHGRPARWGSALDYGCGPGRLSRALAGRFGEVTGVDVSPHMVGMAERLNAEFGNASFELVPEDADSPVLGREYDLVVSSNVLQHIPSSRRALAVLGRLASGVAPGGVAILQLTTAIPLRHSLQPRPRAYSLLRRVGVPPAALERAGLVPIRMKAMDRASVERVFRDAGLRVLERRTSMSPESVRSDVYVAGR